MSLSRGMVLVAVVCGVLAMLSVPVPFVQLVPLGLALWAASSLV